MDGAAAKHGWLRAAAAEPMVRAMFDQRRFDEITAERRALFATGLIELRVSNEGGSRGWMVAGVAADPVSVMTADRYNMLADEHHAMSAPRENRPNALRAK